jgi:Pyruvate/2-oxoacid:ferredoxin oxidoreductase delta subunit
MRTRRQIIRIDEEKCDGCGQCVIACAEGAIKIVDGKARLISEAYCDGLGACIGDCPQAALTIEEREADAFSEEAVEEHLARSGEPAEAEPSPLACGCPSAMAQTLEREAAPSAEVETTAAAPSQLSNWPVQIHLVPPVAPYLDGTDLVIAADCTAFAFADFHRRFLTDRVLLVGCPKLDDAWFYRAKLAEVISQNDIRSVEVVYMEVPCCSGLMRVVEQALGDSGKRVPFTLTKIAIKGEIRESTSAELPAEPAAR